MKRFYIVVVLVIGLATSFSYASDEKEAGPGMMGPGMGQGMMGAGMGCGMMGPGMGYGMMGHGMGYGMMGHGMGYGMMGPGSMWGYDAARYQKFLDETTGLRRQLHEKMFDYHEAMRSPDRKSESIEKLQKEIQDLQGKIMKKARE